MGIITENKHLFLKICKLLKEFIYLFIALVYLNYEKLGKKSHLMLGVFYIITFVCSIVLFWYESNEEENKY